MRNSTNEPNYSTDDEDDDTPEEGDCFEYKPTSLGDSSKKKIKNEELFTHNVTSTLDRNKVTDREAMRLIVSIAAALGGDPTDIPVSRSSIRRKRISNRREFAASIKAAFLAKCVSGPPF